MHNSLYHIILIPRKVINRINGKDNQNFIQKIFQINQGYINKEALILKVIFLFLLHYNQYFQLYQR